MTFLRVEGLVPYDTIEEMTAEEFGQAWDDFVEHAEARSAALKEQQRELAARKSHR